MGIIQENMAQPDALNVQSVKESIQMPPELQDAYERVVLAGMKVMFSKETHRLMLKEIEGEGPIAERLGRGIAGLVLALVMKANYTLPPEVLVPAGLELMMQAVDFLRKTGAANVTDSEIGEAFQVFMRVLFEKFGVDSAQIEQLVNEYDNTAVDAAAQQGGAA